MFKSRVRHDPRQIYKIHADHATGMTTSQIAAKHDLPAVTVHRFLRPLEFITPKLIPGPN